MTSQRLGLVVDTSDDGAVLFVCSISEEQVFKGGLADGAQIGQWYLIENNNLKTLIMSPLHTIVLKRGSQRRIQIRAPAIYLESVTFLSSFEPSEASHFLFSPIVGKIGRLVVDEAKNGSLCEVSAVWMPPECSFFRYMRDVFKCYFLETKDSWNKVANPGDHIYFKHVDYVEMQVKSYQEKIATCKLLNADITAYVFYHKPLEPNQIIKSQIFALSVSPVKKVFVGRYLPSVKLDVSSTLKTDPMLKMVEPMKSGVNVIEARKQARVKPTDTANGPRVSSTQPTVSSADASSGPCATGDQHCFQTVARRPKAPLEATPTNGQLTKPASRPTKKVQLPPRIWDFSHLSPDTELQAIVVSKSSDDMFYVYSPLIPHEVRLVNTPRPFMLSEWVRVSIILPPVSPMWPAYRPQARFLGNVDRKDKLFNVDAKQKGNSVSVTCQIRVPDDFLPGTQGLVTSDFITHIVGEGITQFQRNKTLLADVVRTRNHKQSNRYPDVVWIVSKIYP